ncbi:MAG: transposase [Elusimicrobiota bacterium]
MKKIIKRKKHRLNENNYKGNVRLTVTICSDQRKIIFNKNEIIINVVNFLKEEIKKENIINYIYVFMPNHIHFIIEGTVHSNILEAIRLFKQRSSFYLKKETGYGLQESFYDYIHRKEDDLTTHVRYVLNNPVRKNIVTDFKDYKYLGSIDYNIDDILNTGG